MNRCEEDPCHNMCLNGGRCLRDPDPETDPTCRCLPGSSGPRCEETSTAAYFYLFVVACGSLAVLAALTAFVAFDNWKLRRRRAGPAPSVPDVIKKGHRTRVFSNR